MRNTQAKVKYLTTTKIGEKGQLTIPIEFRDDLGLETGAPLAILRLGDGLILFPENRRFEELCERVSAAFSAAGISREDLLGTLPEARTRLYAQRYGKQYAARKRAGRPRSRKRK